MRLHNPSEFDRIKLCKTFNEFAKAQFNDNASCIVLSRKLEGDFDGLAEKLANSMSIDNGAYKVLTLNALKAKQNLALTDLERTALEQIISDVTFVIDAFNLKGTNLRVIKGYEHSELIKTYHADGSSRILSAYNEPTTQFIMSKDSIKINGNHYKAAPCTKVFALNAGDMWHHRGGEDYVGGLKDLNFIHRAPKHPKNKIRLLLVSSKFY